MATGKSKDKAQTSVGRKPAAQAVVGTPYAPPATASTAPPTAAQAATAAAQTAPATAPVSPVATPAVAQPSATPASPAPPETGSAAPTTPIDSTEAASLRGKLEEAKNKLALAEQRAAAAEATAQQLSQQQVPPATGGPTTGPTTPDVPTTGPQPGQTQVQQLGQMMSAQPSVKDGLVRSASIATLVVLAAFFVFVSIWGYYNLSQKQDTARAASEIRGEISDPENGLKAKMDKLPETLAAKMPKPADFSDPIKEAAKQGLKEGSAESVKPPNEKLGDIEGKVDALGKEVKELKERPSAPTPPAVAPPPAATPTVPPGPACPMPGPATPSLPPPGPPRTAPIPGAGAVTPGPMPGTGAAPAAVMPGTGAAAPAAAPSAPPPPAAVLPGAARDVPPWSAVVSPDRMKELVGLFSSAEKRDGEAAWIEALRLVGRGKETIPVFTEVYRCGNDLAKRRVIYVFRVNPEAQIWLLRVREPDRSTTSGEDIATAAEILMKVHGTFGAKSKEETAEEDHRRLDGVESEVARLMKEYNNLLKEQKSIRAKLPKAHISIMNPRSEEAEKLNAQLDQIEERLGKCRDTLKLLGRKPTPVTAMVPAPIPHASWKARGPYDYEVTVY